MNFFLIISFEKLNCDVRVHSNKKTKQKEKERPVNGTVTSTYKMPRYIFKYKKLTHATVTHSLSLSLSLSHTPTVTHTHFYIMAITAKKEQIIYSIKEGRKE